jgi:septal ring factor EnvC (AmiA/AmiB activator)
MSNMFRIMLGCVVIASLLVVPGCSSSPSEEEMKQLNDMKAEVAAMQKQVSDKQNEKNALERQIAEKNGKLQQCQADQQAVKSALGK